MEIDKVNYPSIDDITVDNNYIAPLLKLLMKFLVSSNLKQNAIGQCLVQAARPRSIVTPIPLALGVDVDHYVGSKNLIVERSRLGFSVSYDEVIHYKQSTVVSSSPVTGVDYPSGVTQWVADNVDHNVITLDGRGTFYCMGIILSTVCLTSEAKFPKRLISRL